MPDTDLTALIERAESGDWAAVGRLIEEIKSRFPGAQYEFYGGRISIAEITNGRTRFGHGTADSLPAAIARAARVALEGEGM